MSMPVIEHQEPAPTERELVDAAWHLVQAAERAGLVLTIERRSLQPFAMGHHEPVVELRQIRTQQ